MSQTPDCGVDTAAYVLGALDDSELDAFRRHLSGCSVCQAEVESFQQLANALGTAAPQYPASKQLRRRVMSDVRADVRARRAVPASDSVVGYGRGLIPRYGTPRYRAGWVGGVAAAVLVLAVVLVGLTAGGTRVGSGRQPSSSPLSSARVYSTTVGSGELIVNSGHGELIVHHLKKLGTNRTYEVWLERSGGGTPQPTSVLFNTSANGDGDVEVPENLNGVSKLMVTKEPAGGRAVPTLPAVVVAELS